MFKLFIISSAKGEHVGRIYVRECDGRMHCVVVWKTGEIMHIIGPASILFRLPNRRELIVEFNGTDIVLGPAVFASSGDWELPADVRKFWNNTELVPFFHKYIGDPIIW